MRKQIRANSHAKQAETERGGQKNPEARQNNYYFHFHGKKIPVSAEVAELERYYSGRNRHDSHHTAASADSQQQGRAKGGAR